MQFEKVVQTMLKDAKLDGFSTNHSLRRSGTTRLFQQVIDCKLIKEFTGHTSDAVDNYQVTSDDQRAKMSSIIQGESCESNESQLKQADLQVTLSSKIEPKEMSCICKKCKVDIEETSNVGNIIEKILSACRGSKATIKIEIEIE